MIMDNILLVVHHSVDILSVVCATGEASVLFLIHSKQKYQFANSFSRCR